MEKDILEQLKERNEKMDKITRDLDLMRLKMSILNPDDQDILNRFYEKDK